MSLLYGYEYNAKSSTCYYMTIETMYLPNSNVYIYDFVILSTTEIQENDPGSITEPPGFVRLIFDGRVNRWLFNDTPPYHYVYNAVDFMFDIATQDWGVIVGFIVKTSPNVAWEPGDTYNSFGGPITSPTTIGAGDNVVFLTGDMKNGLYCSY